MKSNSKLVAKAALFNEQHKVLVLTRSATDATRPGEFDFPGGAVDPGEGPDEAVVREIKEEVSLDIPQLELGYSTTTFYNGESTIRFLYVGKIESTQPVTLSFEHSDFCWMSPDEIFAKYNHPTWVEGLRYVLEHDLLK